MAATRAGKKRDDAKSKGRRPRKGRGRGAANPAEDAVVAAITLGTLAAAAAKATAGRWRGGRRAPWTGRNESRPGSGNGFPTSRPGPLPDSGAKARLRRLGGRFPPLGWALAVQERYGAVHGNNLAAAVTFQSFVSLLPLLLVTVAVVGWLAGSGVDVAGRVISELGLTGDAREAVLDAVTAAQESRRAASAAGLAGLLWSGLGLVNALQYAYDQVWQVEERGLKDKAYGVAWLLGATLLLVATSAATTVLRFLPDALDVVGVVVAFAANVGLWLWTGKILPNTRVPWRAVLPGAVVGAVGLEALKVLGAFYVPRAVTSSSQLYGSLGVVFAILAWLFFFGRLVLYAAVVNVVAYERKAGTVTAVVEVPRQPGATQGQEVSRLGRIPRPAGRSAR